MGRGRRVWRAPRGRGRTVDRDTVVRQRSHVRQTLPYGGFTGVAATRLAITGNLLERNSYNVVLIDAASHAALANNTFLRNASARAFDL